MARKRIAMKNIRKVLQLNEAELSQRQISRLLKISRPVISNIISKCTNQKISYKASLDLTDSDLNEIVYGEPKTSEKAEQLLTLFPDYTKQLKKHGVTKQLLWSEYIQENPNGLNYSQFCNLFRLWQKESDLYMHIDYKAGDKMLVDFAGKKLKIFNAETKQFIEVETFVSLLGCSNLTYVEACESQKTKDFITATENAIHYFGGVPKAIVTDNLKAAVIKADAYEPQLNQLMEDFTRHYRTALLPTRKYKAKDKALVENAVKLTYQRIYAPLRNKTFYSIQELNEAICKLLEDHNNKKMSLLSVSRRQLFDDVEKSQLRSLPIDRYPIKSFATAKVAFNYHVYLKEDQHYYSVPYLYRGQKVDIIYDKAKVAIYFENQRLYVHKRDRSLNKYTTIKDHMPPNHRFYNDWSPKRFKDWACKLGPDIYLVIKYLLETKPHPEQAYKVCLGILNLEKKFGAEALNIACRHVYNRGHISLKQIKLSINLIKPQLDKDADEASNWLLPQEHKNIRGKNNYK